MTLRPIPCQSCQRDLGPVPRRRAFIAVFAQGDEEIRSWFFCEHCRTWTVQEFYDRFHGDVDIKLRGPFPEAACLADVALAQTCKDPGDKWCDCEAHRRLTY